MSSADNGQKLFIFCSKIFEIQIFIAIFEFRTKNAFDWVQTSLVLVR